MREILSERMRSSPRVSAIATAATQFLAMRLLGVTLQEDEARRLATTGNLQRAMGELRERLTITRAVPGMTDDPAFQQRLAVIEVTAAAGMNATERADMIREAMGSQAAFNRAAAEEEETNSFLQTYSSDLSHLDARLRVFMRDVERLYVQQTSRLRKHVADPDLRDRTLERLRQIYTHHIELAVTTFTE